MKLWWKVFWDEFSAVIGGTLAVIGSVTLAASFMYLVVYLTPWFRTAQFVNSVIAFVVVALITGAIVKLKRVNKHYRQALEDQKKRERIETFIDKAWEEI